MKFHSKVFRASDCELPDPGALASSVHLYLEHLYLWHDPLTKGCLLSSWT